MIHNRARFICGVLILFSMMTIVVAGYMAYLPLGVALTGAMVWRLADKYPLE